jgi:hypothetical protein
VLKRLSVWRRSKTAQAARPRPDPLFMRPEMVEDDYYRFLNNPGS